VDNVSHPEVIKAAAQQDEPASPHDRRLEAGHANRPIILVGEAVDPAPQRRLKMVVRNPRSRH
jgi:hypothetical protein